MIWEHELPNEIEYNQEKPFFHTWQGDVSDASLSSPDIVDVQAVMLIALARPATSLSSLHQSTRLQISTRRWPIGRNTQASPSPALVLRGCVADLFCSQSQGGEEGGKVDTYEKVEKVWRQDRQVSHLRSSESLQSWKGIGRVALG